MENIRVKEMLESAKRGNKRAGQGALIKYLSGKRLTQKQAIAANCYNCNGMGELDTCDMEECSLYPYSPYTRKSPRHHPAKQRESKKGIVEASVKRFIRS